MAQLTNRRAHRQVAEPTRPWRARSLLLAAGTFVVGTDAFVISGLLPSLESSLRVSAAVAGQLVTAFSLAYALLAVPLAAGTSSWPRRRVLVAALVVFAVGNAMTAIAPTYLLVLAARIVAAAGAALYTSAASATAAEIAPVANTGRAIAIVLLGLTASLVLGAPLGTALGTVFSWRVTMLVIAAIALLVLPAIAMGVPRLLPSLRMGLMQRLAPLADRRVLVMLTRAFLVFIGIYLPYTYISLVTAPVTGGRGDRLALLLMVFGAAATCGNLVSGSLSDRVGSGRVIVLGSICLVGVFLMLGLLSDGFLPTTAVVAAFGFFSFLLNAPQQHQLIGVAPDRAPILTALYQSVLYLAVCVSGVLGATANVRLGSASIPVVAAVFTASAPVLTWVLARRLSRSRS